MKAPFSPYLDAIAPGLKKLVELLREDFDYVSVLSTDSVGFTASISQRAKAVNHSTMMTERGSVVRVSRGGLYSEYAFNRFDPSHPELTAAEARRVLDEQFALLEETGSAVYDTPVLPDEPCVLREEMETGARLRGKRVCDRLPSARPVNARLQAVPDGQSRHAPELCLFRGRRHAARGKKGRPGRIRL